MTSINFQSTLVQLATVAISRHRAEWPKVCVERARGTRYDPRKSMLPPPREWCARALLDVYWNWDDLPNTSRDIDDIVGASAYAARQCVDLQMFTTQAVSRLTVYLKGQAYAAIKQAWDDERKALALS